MMQQFLLLAGLANLAMTAEDCFTNARGTSCDSVVHDMEEDAKQALDSTIMACLKEVKGDMQDVDDLKQAVCKTTSMRRKFLECFKNDVGGALIENSIFNQQSRSKGKEILKCYEAALK
ncbi:uncharacterized protein LOC121045540 [Ixodes scapularis]|uniref:uncharacterized protein LOC121045540 n=1 Tax=Ixodes scapularis TaxID=6945 RepID=UPI001AD70D71|nr:uncharacterized protein LOC121045540 [Ixodes scapularis]